MSELSGLNKGVSENEHLDSQTHVLAWVRNFTETGKVGELDRGKLARFLEDKGASFKISSDEREKFRTRYYSNKSRSSAMKAVWGSHYNEYKKWCDSYVVDFEKRTGIELPQVVFESGNGSKTEGMRDLFGDLTAYACAQEDEFLFSDLSERNEARMGNFRGKRSRITVKGYNLDKDGVEKPFAPASYPPEFPQKALEFIKSWTK